jgi:hypothetical protein
MAGEHSKVNIVFDNTWDGRIGNEWSRINITDELLEEAIKTYATDYFLGVSVLEGNGLLLELWDDIEEFLIFKGYVVVLEKANDGGRKYFCDIYEEDWSLAGAEELWLTNLDDAGKEKLHVIQNGQPNPKYKFVVFENNRQRKPQVPETINYFIKKIVNVVRKMEIDLFTSERRVMMVVPQQPAEEDVQYQVSTFQNLFFTYIAMQNSRKPDAAQIKQGLTGIKPSQIGEPIFIEPKRDQRADYWRDYYYWMGELEKFIGIRNDEQGAAQKGGGGAERLVADQAKSSQASYLARERRNWRARMRGVREWVRQFEPNNIYGLQYGEFKGTKII